MRCAVCDKTLTSTKEIGAYGVKGWEKKRKEGGTNHLLFREQTGEFMCSTCLVKKTYLVSPDQLTLA